MVAIAIILIPPIFINCVNHKARAREARENSEQFLFLTLFYFYVSCLTAFLHINNTQ